jgi:hypothetical protein
MSDHDHGDIFGASAARRQAIRADNTHHSFPLQPDPRNSVTSDLSRLHNSIAGTQVERYLQEAQRALNTNAQMDARLRRAEEIIGENEYTLEQQKSMRGSGYEEVPLTPWGKMSWEQRRAWMQRNQQSVPNLINEYPHK